MQYISNYNSPLGNITLTADEAGLTGLYFEGQKFEYRTKKDLTVFSDAKRWLDIYFSGSKPDFCLPLHLVGTDFQKEVWKILLSIPYGKTVTYGEIAKQIAKNKGILKMSAQAIGGAAGKNKIAIIVPCHRVVGAGGRLTGYAAGLDKKAALLELEKICVPKGE